MTLFLCNCGYRQNEQFNRSVITGQVRGIDSMLVYCWASVADGGAALNQHWVDALGGKLFRQL